LRPGSPLGVRRYNYDVNEMAQRSKLQSSEVFGGNMERWRSAWEREHAAFLAMREKLDPSIGFVAIYQGSMIDQDRDCAALSHRIGRRYPFEFVLIQNVAEDPDMVDIIPTLEEWVSHDLEPSLDADRT